MVTLGEFNHGLAHLTIVNEFVSVTGILRINYSKLKCGLLLWQRRQNERKLNLINHVEKVGSSVVNLKFECSFVM